MNDDELLQALGAQHRARLERRAPEWADVAHGRRSPQEAADAVRGREDADEAEIARAMELFAPLPEAFDDALVDRLAGGEARPHAEDADTAPETGGAVVERRDRAFWRRGGIAVAIAAAAAALVVVIVRPGSTPGGPRSDAVAQLRALPAFELGVQAVRATVRADHGAPEELQVAAGEAVELMLRPASRHAESPGVWACLQNEDGTRTELRAEIIDAAPGATILARATIPETTATGSWTLVAVVATERPSPDPCALKDAATHRVLRSAISVVAPAR